MRRAGASACAALERHAARRALQLLHQIDLHCKGRQNQRTIRTAHFVGLCTAKPPMMHSNNAPMVLACSGCPAGLWWGCAASAPPGCSRAHPAAAGAAAPPVAPRHHLCLQQLLHLSNLPLVALLCLAPQLRVPLLSTCTASSARRSGESRGAGRAVVAEPSACEWGGGGGHSQVQVVLWDADQGGCR